MRVRHKHLMQRLNDFHVICRDVVLRYRDLWVDRTVPVCRIHPRVRIPSGRLQGKVPLLGVEQFRPVPRCGSPLQRILCAVYPR